MGFSFVVLFVSFLLLHSFQKLNSIDPGFATDRLVLLGIETDSRELREGSRARSAMLQLRDHAQLAGIESASLSGWSLFEGSSRTASIRIPGRDRDPVEPNYLPVSPRFLETMRIRLIDGREFEARDCEADGSSAVIVNEAFARRFFPGESALGKRFFLLGRGNSRMPEDIVGIAANAKYTDLRTSPPVVYDPLRGVHGATLQVRTSLDPQMITAVLRREIRRVHPSFRITSVTLQSTLVENTLIRERLLALLSGFFALVAAILSAVGLYGVLSDSVVQRTKEIGIRVALGARQVAIVRMVATGIALFSLIGLASGLAGGLALSRYVATLLYEVKSTDFWNLAFPIAFLLLACIVAALPPALRAARVDPMVALRYE